MKPRPVAAVLAAVLCAASAPAFAQQSPAPAPAAAPAQGQPVQLRENGLVGVWYPPAPGKRAPAVIVLGGSEGGLAGSYYLGQKLAEQGYAVLGLAYFKAPGLPDQLQDIPLEYFSKGIDWLRAQPGVDPGRIGIWGISKGGEAVLLIASRHPEIKAVVAGDPSSVVWQGVNTTDFTPHASWDENGAPLPYVPYDLSQGFSGWQSIYNFYAGGLKHLDQHQDAIIPVERINGPILLISGKADALWPSAQMADQVMARLDAHGFKPLHVHLSYADAGHAAAVPPSDDPQMKVLEKLGGTPEGNAKARADMWREVQDFFDRTLRK